MSGVTYVSAMGTDAGAVPVGTPVATHPRAGDGKEVQDVYIEQMADGSQLSRLVDADGHQANIQAVDVQIAGDEYGVVTNAIIHGKTAQGNWTDIKANPSGALTVESTIAGIDAGVILPISRADDWYNDAFQSQRVSTKDKRFDAEFNTGKQPLLFDEVGNGTATWSANSRDIVLSIPGTGLGDSEALVQHYYNIYTPLASQFAALTGVINGANLTGTCRPFLRSTVTGTTTTEYAAAITLNWQYSQIFLVDFQSLRVGRVRFGIDNNGIVSNQREITNDNKRVTGYWQSANLPVQWRIYNTATQTITEVMYGDEFNAVGFQFATTLNATQTIRAICAGVRSEGGGDLLDLEGFPFVTPRNAAVTVGTTFIPILSLRVSALFNGITNRGLIIPTAYTLQTSNPIEYAILYRPTLTGASWLPVNATYSGAEYDITASAVSGGIEIDADFLSSGNNQTARVGNLLGKTIMSLGSAGVSDILTIGAIRTGGTNASVLSKLKYKDLR